MGNIHQYCSHFLYDSAVIPAETSIIDENDANDVNQSEITDEEIQEMIDYEIEAYSRMTLVSLNWGIVNDLLGVDIHPANDVPSRATIQISKCYSTYVCSCTHKK